jgi:hypothetical protein
VRALGLLLISVAAHADATPPVVPGGKTPVKAQPGSYRLSNARVIRDECSARIHLAAQHIDIRKDNLWADVVDRTYAHKGVTEAGVSVFEGDFPMGDVPTVCAGTELHESWRLDMPAKHGLLLSSWTLPPDCSKVCTIVFEFDLKKVRR